MFTDERRRAILVALSIHGALSVTDLAKMARASGVTIRRDLRILEERGEIVRRRGGASLSPSARAGSAAGGAPPAGTADERAIAGAAAELVEDGDVLMLGAGTQSVARLLRARRLTVATTSLRVARELAEADQVEVFVVGGRMAGPGQMVSGVDAESAVSRMRFTTLFLTGSGLSVRAGLTTEDAARAGLDRVAVGSSRRVVALVRREQLGVEAEHVAVALTRIDTVVAGAGAHDSHLDALRAAGVEVRHPMDPVRSGGGEVWRERDRAGGLSAPCPISAQRPDFGRPGAVGRLGPAGSAGAELVGAAAGSLADGLGSAEGTGAGLSPSTHAVLSSQVAISVLSR